MSLAGGERVSSVFIEEYMFILAESTGIRLDPMCRVAFQNGGSTLHVRSQRSLTIKIQFPPPWWIILTLDSVLPRLRRFPKVLCLRAHSPTLIDLFLDDNFHSLVIRGTWRHNNGNWNENDVVWNNTRAHRTFPKLNAFMPRSRTTWWYSLRLTSVLVEEKTRQISPGVHCM